MSRGVRRGTARPPMHGRVLRGRVVEQEPFIDQLTGVDDEELMKMHNYSKMNHMHSHHLRR